MSDTCAYDTCNAGFCDDSSGSIVCTCLTGFTGDRCDQKVDQCESVTCDSGKTCQDLISTYRCIVMREVSEDDEDDGDGLNTWLIVFIIAISMIILITAWVLAYIHFTRNPIKMEKSNSPNKKMKRKLKKGINSLSDLDKSKKAEKDARFALLRSKWEIQSDNIEFKSMLDSGEFCQVSVGIWTKRSDPQRVALKRAKDPTSLLIREEITTEFETLAEISGHPNIVTMLGILFLGQGMEPILVLEYYPRGSLHDVLLLMRDPVAAAESQEEGVDPLNPSGETLISFAVDCAKGMRKVAGSGYVFRDVAARNVLVTNNGACKITDFGLAKSTIPIPGEKAAEVRASVHHTALLWRWLAPESIKDNIYSTKSDVWQFGMLLWEIVTLAGVPYPHYNNDDVIEVILSSYKMPKPLHCSNAWYTIMTGCWSNKTSLRPTFNTLYRDLRAMKTKGKNLPNMEEYKQENFLPVAPVAVSTAPKPSPPPTSSASN